MRRRARRRRSASSLSDAGKQAGAEGCEAEGSERVQARRTTDKLPRLDSQAKSTGKQQFAIDVMLPGMMTAVVLRPPRFGGKAQSIDDAAAKAVPGVVDVVQIPRGVAVVAKDMYSAKKGREALKVTWDESGAEKRGTAQIMADYKKLACRRAGRDRRRSTAMPPRA